MGELKASSDLYSKLIRFLKERESYPHQTEQIEHIQTHISYVFIADPFVYKIKKPVDFGFLDYSTLEKRKHFCHQEVELNRRLCEDVYLKVVPIGRKDDSFVLEEEGDAVVEYAVKMKRLPGEYFLHTFINNDELTKKHLDRVAEKLAQFYQSQQPDQEILQYGTIEKIKFNTDENFRQTENFIGQTIDRSSYDAIKTYTNRYFEQNRDLFKSRIEEERIIDGHGDLHLDHIHITPEKVRIYDCIEFNERFRYGDLAVDLAFLAMDLDFNDCWKEERYFVERMAEKLKDPDLHRLIDFYKCYRAYVKGKVKSLQGSEEEVASEDRTQAMKTAVRYFNLSLRYALLGSQPIVLIFMGRIGSGKSTLAGNLAEKLSIESYSSDRIRKSMAGLPLYERTPKYKRPDLYSSGMSRKTYEKLRDGAIENLEQGESVILDATFSSRSGREELKEHLEDHNFGYLFVETQASEKTIKKRLKKREGEDKIVSDARLEDFEPLNENYDPPVEIGSDHILNISTEQSVNKTLGELYLKLVENHLEKVS